MSTLSQTAANVVAGTGAKAVTGTAGGTITAGMPVYIDTGDNNEVKACQSTTTELQAAAEGIALNGASNGQPITYQTEGEINLGATLTAGAILTVDDSAAGAISNAIGDIATGNFVTVLGVATSSSLMKIGITRGPAKA